MIIPKIRDAFPRIPPFAESINSNAAAPTIAAIVIIPGNGIIEIMLLFSKIIPIIMLPMDFAFNILFTFCHSLEILRIS